MTQRQMRNPGNKNYNDAAHTCFPALRSGPQRRRYNMDLLLEANRLIRLASPRRILQC